MENRPDSVRARGEKVVELNVGALQAPEFVVRLDEPQTGSTCLTDEVVLRGWFLAGSDESTRLLQSPESVQVMLQENCERITFLYADMNFYGRKLTEGAPREIRLEKVRVFPAASDQFGPLPSELGLPWCVEAPLNFERLPFGPAEESRTFVAVLRLEFGERVSESNPVCFSLLRRELREEARGGIEYPARSALSAGALVVEGWAMKPGDEVIAAEVFAGSELLGSAEVGLDSPEQAAALPFLEETKRCRFALSLLRRSFPALPPTFPLRVQVTFRSGQSLELNGPQFFWGPEPEPVLLGECETIRVVGEGLIELSGWTSSPDFDSAELYLEGRSWRVSPHEIDAVDRPDIAARFPARDRNLPCGFSVRFHPEILGRTPGVVRLVAETRRGRVVLTSPAASEELTRRLTEQLPLLSRGERAKGVLSRALSRAGIREKRTVTPPLPPAENNGFPRRIVFASHNLSRVEGAPRVLFEIIRSFVASGVSPDAMLLVSAYDGDLGAPIRALGVRVEIRSELRAHDQRWARYHRSLSEIADELRDFNADFIFANVVDSFWAVDAARRLNVPSFWLLHESIDPLRWFAQLEPRLRIVFLTALGACSKLGFVAERTREMFSPVVDSSRTVVIPNGVDEGAIAALRSEWPRERARSRFDLTNEFVISIIGTTTPRKGQDIFLREIAELRSVAPEIPLRAFVVGARDGEYLDELRRLRRALHLENIVEFVGETPHVAPYYAASDALVIASREESAPLVSLEAFAFARPLVSTDVFGLGEQLENEKNALVFGAGARGQLAAALIRIWEDPDLAERLVRGGSATLAEKFSLERSLRRYLEEIERSYQLFT